MEKKGKVLSWEKESVVAPELLILRALGDALVHIGTVKGDEASLLPGTLINLGYLIIEKVEMVGEALGVMEEERHG